MVLSLNSRVERYKREEEASPARVCGVWGVGFRVWGVGLRSRLEIQKPNKVWEFCVVDFIGFYWLTGLIIG